MLSAEPGRGTSCRHILLVDDDEHVCSIFEQLLGMAGHQVFCAMDAPAALESLRHESFDVVVTDISMPEMDGVEFARQVRTLDRDVPIIMVTGYPSVKTAAQGVELGAFRYLVKPVRSSQLLQLIDEAAREHDLARVQKATLSGLDEYRGQVLEKLTLERAFDQTLRRLRMVYQPIVDVTSRSVYAYEALMRSRDDVIYRPAQILHVAERLGRLRDLGRAVRELVAEAMVRLPANQKMFVNLHPTDLEDDLLYSRDDPLARFSERLVLEITERARLDLLDAQVRVRKLRELGYGLALDDLGAGYSGLSSFVQLNPSIVKLDQSLVRGLDQEPSKQKMVTSLCNLCGDMEVAVVAEGVETREEMRLLCEIPVDLVQGYLVGRPEPDFEPVPAGVFEPQPALESA